MCIRRSCGGYSTVKAARHTGHSCYATSPRKAPSYQCLLTPGLGRGSNTCSMLHRDNALVRLMWRPRLASVSEPWALTFACSHAVSGERMICHGSQRARMPSAIYLIACWPGQQLTRSSHSILGGTVSQETVVYQHHRETAQDLVCHQGCSFDTR